MKSIYSIAGKVTKASGMLAFLVKNKAFTGTLNITAPAVDFKSPAGKTFTVDGRFTIDAILVGKSLNIPPTAVVANIVGNEIVLQMSVDTTNASGTASLRLTMDWKTISAFTADATAKSALYKLFLSSATIAGTGQQTGVEPDPGPGPVPSGKLITDFLLKGQEGSKYTNSAGRTSTLSMANDGDRTAMDKQRLYVVNYLQSIKANCLPMIVCNDDPSVNSYCNPFKGSGLAEAAKLLNDTTPASGGWIVPRDRAKLLAVPENAELGKFLGSGWGGTINGDYQAWMWYADNDVGMFGRMCSSRGISQIPILFCSENRGGPFTNPSWAEQFVKDMTPFFITHGNVKWICTHLEAEKFVDPAEVNRIAGFVRKYMPGVGICVHATNTSFAKCDVDAISVQMPWHPKDGDAHSPDEVVKVLKSYLSAGAKKIIAGEYNWNSEGATAKAQGQAALTIPECIGAWCGW